MTNNVADVRKYFKKLYKQKIFSTDKTGQKTIEMVPASFVADEEIIFGKENKRFTIRIYSISLEFNSK